MNSIDLSNKRYPACVLAYPLACLLSDAPARQLELELDVISLAEVETWVLDSGVIDISLEEESVTTEVFFEDKDRALTEVFFDPKDWALTTEPEEFFEPFEEITAKVEEPKTSWGKTLALSVLSYVAGISMLVISLYPFDKVTPDFMAITFILVGGGLLNMVIGYLHLREYYRE